MPDQIITYTTIQPQGNFSFIKSIGKYRGEYFQANETFTYNQGDLLLRCKISTTVTSVFLQATWVSYIFIIRKENRS